MTGKKQMKRQLQELMNKNTKDAYDNTSSALENQVEAITGVDKEQNTDNTYYSIQSNYQRRKRSRPI